MEKPDQQELEKELEREVRRGRKFTLSEAIGRLAGPGAMKGVSPVSRMRQAEAELTDYLSRHLDDPPGALKIVVARRVRESEWFLRHYDQPLVVLAGCVHRALESEYLLKAIVDETDIEWGKLFDEPPYFEKEGLPPDPRDPYTRESVKRQLESLYEKLADAVEEPRGS